MTILEIKQKELIEAQKEYINFLSDSINNNIGFLNSHDIQTSQSVVIRGIEIRKKIKELEERITI